MLFNWKFAFPWKVESVEKMREGNFIEREKNLLSLFSLERFFFSFSCCATYFSRFYFSNLRQWLFTIKLKNLLQTSNALNFTKISIKNFSEPFQIFVSQTFSTQNFSLWLCFSFPFSSVINKLITRLPPSSCSDSSLKYGRKFSTLSWWQKRSDTLKTYICLKNTRHEMERKKSYLIKYVKEMLTFVSVSYPAYQRTIRNNNVKIKKELRKLNWKA